MPPKPSVPAILLPLSLFSGLVTLFLGACVDTSSVNLRLSPEQEKRVTFLLVDNSLSYNNPQDPNSQKVMELVSREIVSRLRQARAGDHLVVRTIQSESNQLSAMIATLNLTGENLHFRKPEPTNPIELKVWEKEKREFEAAVAARISGLVETAVTEYETRSAKIFATPSNQTDFVGALLTCQRFYEKRDYDTRNLVIYSDMVEDAALEDAALIDLRGVAVEARFVTKPTSEGVGNTHLYFKDLETFWRDRLNADRFDLYEVQNSF